MAPLGFWSDVLHKGQEEALAGVSEASSLLHWAEGSFSLSWSFCELFFGVGDEV